MIDKLVIASHEMNSEALKKAFGDTLTSNPQNNLYDLCERISSKTGKHLFTVYEAPRNPNMKPYRLELNPSKLGLKFHALLGKLDLAMDIGEATIQRIDHASDYEIPVTAAFESVRVKYKRNVKSFTDYKGGELTGFYIGSKFEQYVIYNKAYELKGKTFKAVNPAYTPAPLLTRFEVRHHTKNVPFRSLKDLPFLMSYDPFERLEVLELKEGIDKDIDSGLRSYKGLHGMQNSYLQLNKWNNYRRDASKYFNITDLPSKLSSIYRDNLGQFFEEP